MEEYDRALVKTLQKRGQKLQSRIVPRDVVNEWHEKIEGYAAQIEEIEEEERAEKHMQKAEMEATKAENMLEHANEIKSRPKKTWFESERDKLANKKAAAKAMGKQGVDLLDDDDDLEEMPSRFGEDNSKTKKKKKRKKGDDKSDDDDDDGKNASQNPSRLPSSKKAAARWPPNKQQKENEYDDEYADSDDDTRTKTKPSRSRKVTQGVKSVKKLEREARLLGATSKKALRAFKAANTKNASASASKKKKRYGGATPPRNDGRRAHRNRNGGGALDGSGDFTKKEESQRE